MMKADRTKNLRWKKPLSRTNFDQIQDDLNDIEEACDEVRYYIEGDDETLINALNGDDEEAYEFRMMFADLAAECEHMRDDMDNWYEWGYPSEVFDLFFTAVDQSDLLGYDFVECDYYALDPTESDWGAEEAKKKLMRLTKEQIIDAGHVCFHLLRNYTGLMYRYDCLKATFDILRDKNTSYLKLVKQIEETYDKAERETEGFKYLWRSDAVKDLDRLIACMPQEAWL